MNTAHATTTRGAALLSVLLFLLLIMIVTVGVMGIVQSELATGIRQQQAVQVFNIAEAGVHHAIARLQGAGADTYTGETVVIADPLSGARIGTAEVTVTCVDGTSSPAAGACAGAEPAYRRITSTGFLTVSGPRRVVTAVVEGTTSPTGTYAVCAYQSLSLDQNVTIYGSVGSNGSIALQGPSATRAAICNSGSGGLAGRCGTPNPAPPPDQPFGGSAFAVGAITCSQRCATQVEDGAKPNQPGPVCPAVTLTPPPGPGAERLDVGLGQTVEARPTVNYGAVTLASSPGNPTPCPTSAAQRATLYIDAGPDPNATVTIRMASLWLGKCARLEIRGQGKVELWLLEPIATALSADQRSVFGTTSSTPTADPAAETPIEGHRLTVNVVSTNSSAVVFNQAGLIAGTFLVPRGGFRLDQAQLTNGAVLADTVHFDRGTTFTWDPRSRIGAGTYTNFSRLRSWKDQ